MPFKNLTLEFQGKIAIATLHRPNNRNALSLEMMQELIGLLGVLEHDPDVRAVILASSGKAFCSGHDLSEMVGVTANDYRRIFDTSTQLMEKIQALPQPVIAEVQGVATAAGCQLVASCDLVVASDEASFAAPGVKIGLFCSTPMVPLVRAIGRKRAMQMLLTGDAIDAQTAAEWGLVNFTVAGAELRDATLKLTSKIVLASPSTLEIGKRAFYAQVDLDQTRAYSHAKEVMITNALTSDAQEGMRAFLGKRAPVWAAR